MRNLPNVHTTYSFTDVHAIISHPDYGSFSLQGEGVGDFVVSMSTDRTVHDVASDGHIMVSKIAGNNGQVVINAQQTSNMHKWLLGLYNYLWSADTNAWSEISLTIHAPEMDESTYCKEGAFLKIGDKPHQSQGQRVAWTILFADVQQLPMA